MSETITMPLLSQPHSVASSLIRVWIHVEEMEEHLFNAKYANECFFFHLKMVK